MLDSDLTALGDACATFAVPVPKAVITATATKTEADTLLAEIRAEQPASLDGMTARTVREIHHAMLASSTRAERERAAETIAHKAKCLVHDAWFASAGHLLEAFREPFNREVATFANLLDALGGNTDADAAIDADLAAEHRAITLTARRLRQLAAVRWILGSTHLIDVGMSGGSDNLRRHGQVMTFPDLATVVNRLNGRVSDHPVHSLEWWAAALSVPGLRIEWHTPDEQQTIHSFGRGAA